MSIPRSKVLSFRWIFVHKNGDDDDNADSGLLDHDQDQLGEKGQTDKERKREWGAVAVAHLAERSLPTTGNPGSNPFMSNFVKEHLFYVTCTEKI